MEQDIIIQEAVEKQLQEQLEQTQASFIKKLRWRWLERSIYLLTIVVGIQFYIRDEAVEKATMEVTIVTVTDDIGEIKDKLDEYGKYWLEQRGINARIITYIDVTSKPE